MRKSAAFFNIVPRPGSVSYIDQVYRHGRRDRVAASTHLYPEIITPENFAAHAPALAGVEVIFSTWGMPKLTEDQLAQMPALRAVFYAAGSVRGFAEPFLQRGITVVSANYANGTPVAEFTLGQILLAGKGYFRNTREYRSHAGYTTAFRGPGNYGETVALLGAGAIARQVIAFLRVFALQVVVVDPYLTDVDAEALGVRRVTLEEAFETAFVVSSHVPNLPSTRGMLHGDLFRRLRPGATFINTGRGAQIVEEDLIAVLRERPDLTVLLDVTDPEPVPDDSPFLTLPNVQLSAHLAGSMHDEVVRMADLMIDEFLAWEAGKPLTHEVTPERFAVMA